MAYDNTCKYLAEKFPTAFVRWLLPIDEPTNVQVLKTELIQEPIRADSLVFLQLEQIANRIATMEEPNQQADLIACTQVLAVLRFEKDLIRQLFRKETLFYRLLK